MGKGFWFFYKFGPHAQFTLHGVNPDLVAPDWLNKPPPPICSMLKICNESATLEKSDSQRECSEGLVARKAKNKQLGQLVSAEQPSPIQNSL